MVTKDPFEQITANLLDYARAGRNCLLRGERGVGKTWRQVDGKMS